MPQTTFNFRQLSSSSDGQIIAGVAHFVRPTVPVTRVNGSALVAGDRWYKTTDNGFIETGRKWWIWNGTYWISEVYFEARYVLTGRTNAGNGTVALATPFPVPPWSFQIDISNNIGSAASALVWVPRILYSYRAATADANNYWLLGFAQSSYVPSSGTVVGSNWQTGVFTINNNLTANGSHQINRVLSTGGSAYSFATVPSAVTSLIGTPGSLSIMYNYICHYVHPVPASPI